LLLGRRNSTMRPEGETEDGSEHGQTER
jgi:hypothetical protein